MVPLSVWPSGGMSQVISVVPSALCTNVVVGVDSEPGTKVMPSGSWSLTTMLSAV